MAAFFEIDLVALLTWYRDEGRSLPWRSDPTPYAVLLSELMCQQTRVETALPYFKRFMARWPTMADLAAADENDVVEAWAGLGYYSRARRLHQCAIRAVALRGLPTTSTALRELPGIGAYTAGAIASIAFAEAVPAVDGNVQRVMARQARLEKEPSAGAGRREIETAVRHLHECLPDGAHPGDLNQALMELGARVCTPRKPRCSSCPVRGSCDAATVGDVLAFPVKKPRKAAKRIEGIAGLLRGPEGVFLVRKPRGELLGGLWTPPVVLEPAVDPVTALLATFADAGWQVKIGAHLGSVRHIFTHRDLQASVHEVIALEPCERTERWDATRWSHTPAGISTLAKKLLAVGSDSTLALGLLAADRPAI